MENKKALSVVLIVVLSFYCLIIPSEIMSQNTCETIEGKISVPGGKVWYKIVGANRSGIPILVLHGGPGGTHDYLEPVEALSDERPVIFYDQLGSGFSDKPQDNTLWTIERFVEEMDIVRNELKLNKLHILGQSWGSMLAVDYIVKKGTDGIVSLTLSGPFLDAKRWSDDQREWIRHLPEKTKDTILKYEATGEFDNPGYLDAVNVFYAKHLCNMNPWPESLMRTMSKMGAAVYQYMIGPSEFTLTGTLKDYDLTSSLNKLTMPVLLTCGEFDEARPESVEYFQKKIPGSQINIFKGATHSHHLEKSDEYIKLLRNFILKAENPLR